MKKRIKICHIIHSLEVGGAEMLLFRICNELTNRYPDSYEFVIIASCASGPLKTNFERIGIKVISLGLGNSTFLIAIFRIFLSLLKERPDTVHTHLLPPDKYGQIAAFLALVQHRVSTIHSMEPKPSRAEIKAITIVKLLATRIIAVSRSVKENVVTRYRYTTDKICVIHTAPSSSAGVAHPKVLSFPVSIVNLANVREIKGHHYLVPAAVEIRKVTSNFTIDILGSADSAFADSIRKGIADNDLGEHVFLKGKTDNPCALLPQYTCMISLSQIEGFPLSVIEGMSAGLPLILSDIPPHRELLDGIKNIHFVRPDSPQDIAASFNRLISDANYYSWLSAKMLERSHHFSIPTMIQKYHTFYQSL